MSQLSATKRKVELNKVLNAKRKPEDRHLRFSSTIEVGLEEQLRLDRIRDRIKDRIQTAKDALGIIQVQILSQSALNCFSALIINDLIKLYYRFHCHWL